jgi:hypothetical protein
MLHDMLIAPEVLIPRSDAVLPASVVYTNAGRIGLAAFEQRMVQSAYRSRRAAFDPVLLGRLPAGITMLGGEFYWLWLDDVLVADQINPLVGDRARTFEDLLAPSYPTETIEEPCLLVARYGDLTWGHWVGEILPRAVMAERAHPGRFRFVLSERITTTPETRGYATAILESLAAFGIGKDRILQLRADRQYQFTSLHAVSGIWSMGRMNRGVMDAMRSIVRSQVEPAGQRRVAVLRRGNSTRGFSNTADVEALLARQKFHAPAIDALGFVDQVALFLDADMIFGAQGSGLINLIFAPQGIKVISVAPSAWHDTFFHPLIQARDGWHADLRGPTLWTGVGLQRDAPVLAIESDIEAAIVHLDRPAAALAPDGMVDLAGHVMPRRLGPTMTTVTFGATGNASQYTQHGWSWPEPTHTWSVGPFSTLKLPSPRSGGGVSLEIDVMALVLDRGLIGRPLDVMVNGVAVGSAMIEGFDTVAFVLPAACLAGHDWLDIVFVHPLCVSPRVTGHGEDDRDTALSFLALRLVAIEEPRIAQQREAA